MADNKIVYEKRPMVRDLVREQVTDIIIPFHGQAAKMINAVQSVYKNTKTLRYRITLVDDCSPNDQLSQSFTKAPRIQYLRTPKHIGFGGAVDLGLHSTNNTWVCIMHSDVTVLHPQWLDALIRCMARHRDQKVMMVSACADNPGEGVPPRLKRPRNQSTDDEILEDGFLPMYCALMHRQLFTLIKGYLKAYPYAMYEDVELAARMKRYGLQQAICGASWVSHVGGATINELCRRQEAKDYEGPDYRGIMEANYDRCVQDITKQKAVTA